MMPGWLSGFIGVAIFSGSLPATRLAVAGFDPFFLTAARASLAAVLAFIMLRVGREPLPRKGDLLPLLVVAGGVVVGFPLLSGVALQRVGAAHATVFVGLLPLCTAFFAFLRGGERPRPLFWFYAGLGSLIVAGFAAVQSRSGVERDDLTMLAGILLCALGYAEGGRLARRLGGWQVICWALVLALPPMLGWTLYRWTGELSSVPLSAWLGLAYVSLFSMLIGFIFWYRGLAKGGIAAVGQLQLLQPFLSLALAALLLGEQVSLPMLAATSGVIACVFLARRHAHGTPATGSQGRGMPFRQGKSVAAK